MQFVIDSQKSTRRLQAPVLGMEARAEGAEMTPVAFAAFGLCTRNSGGVASAYLYRPGACDSNRNIASVRPCFAP
jgi:hypothetical protein